MNPENIIEKLGKNHFVFKHLFAETSFEEFNFKSNGNWSLLEVACHLLDEEIEDFRARIEHILTTPDKPLKSISPQKWPLERNYSGQDFGTVVERFLSERKKSLEWLKSLQQPKWEQTVYHPAVGERSAKKFLFNWLAHDYHHIRQINRIQHTFLKFSRGDDLTYAGKW